MWSYVISSLPYQRQIVIPEMVPEGPSRRRSTSSSWCQKRSPSDKIPINRVGEPGWWKKSKSN